MLDFAIAWDWEKEKVIASTRENESLVVYHMDGSLLFREDRLYLIAKTQPELVSYLRVGKRLLIKLNKE